MIEQPEGNEGNVKSNLSLPHTAILHPCLLQDLVDIIQK